MKIIVGAGLTGATLARLFAESGEKVTVYEKNKYAGGLCADKQTKQGDIVQRYGPHYFHTNDIEIIDFVSQYAKWEKYELKVVSSIDGVLYSMPPPKEVTDIEYWNKFVLNYTVKQWGIDARYIDSAVFDRLRKRSNEDRRYFSDEFQAVPTGGYTDFIESLLAHENITVFYGVKIPYAEKGMIWTGRLDKTFSCAHPLVWRKITFKTVRKQLNNPVVNYPGKEPYTRESIICPGLVQREYLGWVGKTCYPMPVKEYQEEADRMKEKVKERCVILAGRLGTYSYLNMDQAIRKAIDLFKELTK